MAQKSLEDEMAKSKVISGTAALKQNITVIKANGNNVTKIRCRCGQFAHPVPDGKGGTMLHCKGCGANFTSQAL